jgi:predicted MPP superfamily phosphohydrolase
LTDYSNTIRTPAFPERAAEWKRVPVAVCRRNKQRLTAEHFHQLPEPFCFCNPGLKIAFISDLHYTGSPKCKAILDEIVASLRRNSCQLLLLGGDICSDASKLHLLPEILERLAKCADRCIAIPGNWERGKCWLPAEIITELDD